MTRSLSLASPSVGAERGRPTGRVSASIVEQGAFSALQFSPAVAAALSRSGSGLGWTASFTACLGLTVALYRGAVIHPAIRSGNTDRRCSGRAFIAVTIAAAAVLVPAGLGGAFDNRGSLLVLGCAAPLIGLVDLNRALSTSPVRIVRAGMMAGAGATVVAGLPLLRPDVGPVLITTVWTAAWAVMALWFLLTSASARPGRGVSAAGAWSLTINNLVGQLAANGPLLVVAALLAGDALSEVQAARIPLRPMTILAAALPVHYLPYLARNRGDRLGPPVGAATIVGASAVAAAILAALALLVLSRAVESFSTLSITSMALAAAAGVASVAEAVAGLWAVADHREWLAATARLTALAVGLAVVGLLAATGRLGVTSALVALLIAPVAISGFLTWKLLAR